MILVAILLGYIHSLGGIALCMNVIHTHLDWSTMQYVLSVLVLVAGYIYAIAGMARVLNDIRHGKGDYEYLLAKSLLQLCQFRTIRIIALAIAPFVFIVYGVSILVFVTITELPSFVSDTLDNVRSAVRKSK